MTITPLVLEPKIPDIWNKPLPSKSDNKSNEWFNRGVVLINLGEFEKAIACFDKSLEIQENDYYAWYNRGLTLINLQRYGEALFSFQKSLENGNNNDYLFLSIGLTLSALSRYAEAIGNYDQCLKININCYDAWLCKAIAITKLKEYEAALNTINQAIDINPDLLDFWMCKGNILAILTRYEEAITSYNQALIIKNDYDRAFYCKAVCYSLLGNIEKVIENLQQAICLNPEQWIGRAKTESEFDNIREDGRFQALIDGEIRTVRHNVSWEEFENLLAEKGDSSFTRVAYDRGVLEIVMPSDKHEFFKDSIGDLIKDLADELEIDYCVSLGSTTWKREDLLKGVEPDKCFYIQNAVKILNKIPGNSINLYEDPPPDLVLEVDYTSPSTKKMSIYSALGVPELWIYNMKKLCVYQLQNGEYQETENSLAFFGFPVQEIPDFIQRNMQVTRKEFKKALREWVNSKRNNFKVGKILEGESFQSLIDDRINWEEEDIDEDEWLKAAASNPVFDFLKDPEEDIYTLNDGKPFND
jgi:tetratricopeptide (TPR) repeat protein